MVAFFRHRKSVAPPPPEEEEPESPFRTGTLASRLNVKEIELYPTAIRLLWFYYDPSDQGGATGREKEFPGPVDETTNDSVRELEKINLLEVIPTFNDFSITARLTGPGLKLMASQPTPGTLSVTEQTDPVTGATTVEKSVNLG